MVLVMSNGWNGPPSPTPPRHTPQREGMSGPLFLPLAKKSRGGDFTSDRGSYEGKFKNRKYKNGMSYEPRPNCEIPNWKNGVRHGQSILTYSNGDVYKGEFNDGKRSGRGCLTCRNGNIFYI